MTMLSQFVLITPSLPAPAVANAELSYCLHGVSNFVDDKFSVRAINWKFFFYVGDKELFVLSSVLENK